MDDLSVIIASNEVKSGTAGLYARTAGAGCAGMRGHGHAVRLKT